MMKISNALLSLIMTIMMISTMHTGPYGLVMATARVVDSPTNLQEVKHAIDLLLSLGVPKENLCTTLDTNTDNNNNNTYYNHPMSILPLCCSLENQVLLVNEATTVTTATAPTTPLSFVSWLDSIRYYWIRSNQNLPSLHRQLLLNTDIDESGSEVKDIGTATDEQEDEEENKSEDVWFYVTHAICALFCVTTAAVAAGLTMGLLSLDPLMLLIKIRAGSTKKEQEQAAALLPIVKQHHLLLVTLLLLNSLANEALPLFLEVLVSPIVAVILSVTLVLFFGEIIPSAIFTGPNKVEIAYHMVPLVKLVMLLLWPLAYPIATLLDMVLHHDGDDDHGDGGGAFDRGELSALVRIQYEERMAHKQRKKAERKQIPMPLSTTTTSATAVSSQRGNTTTTTTTNTSNMLVDNVGGLDFSSRQMIKASKRQVERAQQQSSIGDLQDNNNPNNNMNYNMMMMMEDDDEEEGNLAASSNITELSSHQRASIHVDEVSMVEGALSMKTKVALDVYTPLHRMFGISYDMILNETNVVQIYSSGFSRIPVFLPNPNKPKSMANICGILRTKQLIVVNTTEERPLSTLPLAIPRCVSPKMNLVDLLNLFQTGRLGHLALVCARPNVGQEALEKGLAIPETAGLMGIITLEDVLEALLQEQIYDESDKLEREALRLAKWATRRWKSHVRKQQQQPQQQQQQQQHDKGTGTVPATTESGGGMRSVVERAMEFNEQTHLLEGVTAVAEKTEDDAGGEGGFDPIGGIMGLFGKLLLGGNNTNEDEVNDDDNDDDEQY